MGNEKGNMTLLSIIFLLSLSSWSIVFLQNEAKLFKELKARLRVFTCMKRLNGESKRHIKWMEGLNKTIEVANAAMVSANPVVISIAKATKKGAQLGQQVKHISFLKDLVLMTKNKCLFDPYAYKTPYKNKGLLTRDSLGRASLRSKKWKQASIGTQVILRTKVEKSGNFGLKMKSESWEIQEGLSLLNQL